MRPRHTILLLTSLSTFVALFVLLVQVRADAEVAVPDDALTRARQMFERHSRVRQAGAATPSSAPRTTPVPPPSVATATPARPSARPTAPSRRPRAQMAGSSGDSGELSIDDVRAFYDRGNFFDALEAAERYLRANPDQAYIRRVAVTSACAVGEEATARRYYEQMSKRDQRTVGIRCGRYGVRF
ncbi:hypothetical protein [Haliangium ochraceum]|uniref:Uncharacterized protein n=1 Tax=Haliangium ochraceum (strain DSM 14365 / JCM 11303 / SMP-2) TaxID=502025 RepID=D0LLG0_HALO1|nr:hypothetical protein [Haliangium ochraceum]ACY13177.1 hypothetical protein Hoch_0539 [Haliangium ochraceum DSM 14365]